MKNSILDKVLFAMLTENTGRHLLDSGGAYGRNWERNQKLTLDAMRKRPAVIVSGDVYQINGDLRGDLNVTVSVFHFLREALGFYRADLTRKLWRFGQRKEWENEGWLSTVDAWLESLDADPGEMGGNWVNTYNHESSLSQVLQYRPFSLDGDEFVALQIHGGCDVRGGYTRPRVFELPRMPDVTLYDDNRFVIDDGKNAWYYMGTGCGYEPSEHNERECDLGKAEFTNDPAERGKGKIYVENGVAHSPLNGAPLSGYII